jgi:hypothetical protein
LPVFHELRQAVPSMTAFLFSFRYEWGKAGFR